MGWVLGSDITWLCVLDKNKLESEIQLASQTSKTRTYRQYPTDVEHEKVPDKYIDPDIIKAFTGQSAGIKN